MNTPNDPRLGWTSASNATADRLCPGRHTAQKGLPDTKGEWADYGQQIHAALAENPREGENVGALAALTTDQRDMFDAHREVEKKLIATIWPDVHEVTPTRVWRHERFWCKVPILDDKPYTAFFQHSGEADFVMRRGDKGLIQDYKSLAGDVPESPKNEQLRDLAVMAWRALILKGGVWVVINQPLHTWTPEICFYSEADLERAEQEMWERVRASNKPDAQRVAGEPQCKHCRARFNCPEHAQWTALIIPQIADITTPVAEWTPEDRALFCNRRAIAQAWLDDCEAQMKKLLAENPEAVPGWFLKDGATREIINNPQELFERFSAISVDSVAKEVEKEYGDSPQLEGLTRQRILSLFMACVKITKGDLETQVRAVTATKGVALKSHIKKLLDGIVEVKQNAPSLARKKE